MYEMLPLVIFLCCLLVIWGDANEIHALEETKDDLGPFQPRWAAG